jgi:hypothetical protein
MIHRESSRLPVQILLALFLGACPPHGETIPLIHVDPRAAGRLDLLAHRAPAPGKPSARVHVMAEGEALGGPNVVGRAGDLVLENDEVVFVIDQLGPGAGFAESGGNVVDAADAHVRRDELGQLFTYFGTFPRQGVYDHLASGAGPDGSAWVEVRGRELLEHDVAVTTRYTLHGPDRALLIETTVENDGKADVVLPGLGDAIEWGGALKTAAGKAPGFTGPSRGPYVGGVGRFTSYALASTEGDVEAVSGHSWTDTTLRSNVTLAPSKSAGYARVFLVGERPDTSSLVGELALAAGEPVGEVRAEVPEGGTQPTGYFARLRAEGATETLTLAPPFDGDVPVGRYHLVDASGQPIAGVAALDVAAGGVAHATLPMDAPASLDVRCTGPGGAPMPCKVTFEGQSPTPTPAFGFLDASGPAGNQATTATGDVHVDLAAGRYRVYASRGPEYSLAAAAVALAAGEHAERTLAIDRVLDTRGYVGCDFHQHTMRGMDSGVGTRDRVVANAAEGVEVAVASEHNVVSSLQPLVADLGLAREMVSLAGDELTSDALASPWGHANAYPLATDASKPRGGTPSLSGRTAREVFAEVRRAFGDVVLQINHPRSGRTGYFDLLGFEPKTGAGTAAGYDASFDALEVWNGRNVDARGRIVDDLLSLLRAGHRVTPTADTDTHGVIGQESGYPRTYVRVADDTHLEAWDAARSADLVHGIKVLRDVVLTNGPMLRISASGSPIGATVHARLVHVIVEVESAPWVEVDEVSIVRASGAPVDAKKITEKAAGSVLRATTSFDVRASADDAFVVVARGTRPLSPVLAGDASDDALKPWAMTGAIWIDASGSR